MLAVESLPVSLETERLVIGSMLLYPTESAPIAIDLLTADDFTAPDHQKAFRRISAMVAAGDHIDFLTFGTAFMHHDRFPQNSMASFLLETTRGLPKIFNLDSYCAILRERSSLRTAILTLSAGVGRLSGHGATLQTISEIQASVAALGDDGVDRSSGLQQIADIIENVDGGGASRFLSALPEEMGIPWPLASITAATGGFRPGNTTVIGADTGGGKTTMATMCALHAATLGYGVAIFSPEMTKWEVAKKIIAQYGGFCLSDWMQGTQTHGDRNRTAATARAAKELLIAIDERPDITPSMMEAAILRLRKKQRVDLVIVDYIQLVDSGQKDDGLSRERHVAYNSRALKKLCKRLGMAGLILTQLTDEGKVRESRQIKMDCSNMLTLKEKGNGVFEGILEKARFQAKRRIPLFFDGATGIFSEGDAL